MKENNNNKDNRESNFIREKVVRKRKSLGEIIKSGGFFCVEALAFGVLTAVAFAWMEPRADFLINGEDEPVINLGDTKTTILQETTEDSTTKSDETTKIQEQPVQNKNSVKLEDINKSMVIVSGTAKKSGRKENKPKLEDTSGVVINADKDIYILTDYCSVKDREIILVTFDDDIQCVANIRKYSEDMDMAVLVVKEENLISGGNKPGTVKFGKSEKISVDEELIYGGVSQGVGCITDFCRVLETGRTIQMTDCVYDVYATNLASNVAANGFLFDRKGRMMGMITHVDSSVPNLVSMFGISDIKAVIEKLSNGRTLPYVGVTGTTVTRDMVSRVDTNMPYGVYVSDVDAGSPAYMAGIVKGDIIISLGSTQINTVEEYSYAVNSLVPGNKIEYVVERKGQNGYKKISFVVTVNRKNSK